MQRLPKKPTAKNPPANFTGDVWVDSILTPQADGQRASAAKVRFSPGAHTNWHSHALGQTLYVTEGLGLVQNRGGEILEIRPGDTIYTPPGEEHWHGATPDDFMEHIALMDIPDDPATATTWLEPVTDAEYPGSAR
ncbi:quercetin dioxygenase-like cupin family protein [Frondihabitans sp. PhB188]|uniref:(R)-mandelonitrile lyase n=1 Tax=Frondihabitans sp. PhB188 TaxID=2485200 RepID=UPI000F46BB83|nr:cupin domain-containing protein [Frondihabitans sp. PhB188]ROQ37023.1 quercetin dioxygenase-like cupin family protein [Frondihabitans sp. PhB188]